MLMSGLAEEVVELDKLFLGIFISKRVNSQYELPILTLIVLVLLDPLLV